MEYVDGRARRLRNRHRALHGNHLCDDRGTLAEVVNRAAPLGHEPLLGLGHDRIVFCMQHAQHADRAGRLEDSEPGQSVEVERLPGEEVLPRADKAPTRQLVEHLSRKPSGLVPDGHVNENVGHR